MSDDSETRAEPDTAARPPRRRAPWIALALALLLVLVLGGVGSAPYWAPQVTPLLPWAKTSPPSDEYARLAARVATLEAGARATAAAAANAGQESGKAVAATTTQLRTLEQRVAALEGKTSAPAVDPAQIAAMQKQLADLEKRPGATPAAAPAQIAALEKRLSDLEKRPAASAASPPSPPAAAAAPPQQAVAKLEQQIAALAARSQSRAQQLREEIAKLKAEQIRLDALTAGLADRVPALAAELQQHRAAGHTDAALFLGLLQLRQAVGEGRPFAQEYKAFETLARDWPDLADAAKPLSAAAATGVANRVTLLRGLAELAGRIEAKKPLPAKKDWRSRLADEVASLVKVRRIDKKGGASPRAAVDAAQVALAHNDLAAAVKALEPLTGAAADAARPWLDQARRRLAAETALSRLQDLMVRELVGTPAVPAGPAAPAAPANTPPANAPPANAPPAGAKKPGAPS